LNAWDSVKIGSSSDQKDTSLFASKITRTGIGKDAPLILSLFDAIALGLQNPLDISGKIRYNERNLVQTKNIFSLS
jgi:hypothetical protein